MRKDLGYVKFYRQYLVSDIHNASFSARACFIDILLLLDRKTGVLCISVAELTKALGIKERKTTYKVLRELEAYDVIKITWTSPLEIMVPNWAFFQRIKKVEKEPKTEPESVYKIHTKDDSKVCKKYTPSVYKIHNECVKNTQECVKNTQGCVKNTHSPYACKQEILTRSKQELLQEGQNQKNEISQTGKSFDFLNPQTDLEKFVNFYLKGTESPLLSKNNNSITKALKFELQHFQSVLDRTKDLKQAKGILTEYIRQAKGTYSIFYLAQQIDSRRAEFEEKHPN